jgi:hypothetical protein
MNIEFLLALTYGLLEAEDPLGEPADPGQCFCGAADARPEYGTSEEGVCAL